MSSSMVKSETSLDTSDIQNRNKQVLLDKLAGLSIEQISIRRGVPPGQIKDCLESALDDLKTKNLHADIRTRIVDKLINNILELSNWKDELQVDLVSKFQAVDGKGTVHDLIKDDSKDRELMPKYMGELRQLYMLLDKMVQLKPDDIQDDDDKKVNDAILGALIQVAQNNGALQEKIKKEDTKIISVDNVSDVQDAEFE